MSALRLTTLPLHAPSALLAALQSNVDPEELLCANQVQLSGSKSVCSVHAYALAGLLCADTAEDADAFFACCQRLVELRAPVTHCCGDGVVSQFCAYLWPPAGPRLNQVRELADAYLAAGMWDVDKPLDGELLPRGGDAETEDNRDNGLSPMACAILRSNPPMVQWLCDRGASLDVGPVYAGEESVHAIDLALANDQRESHAIVVAAAMARQINAGAHGVSTEQSTSTCAPARTSRQSPTQRRLV